MATRPVEDGIDAVEAELESLVHGVVHDRGAPRRAMRGFGEGALAEADPAALRAALERSVDAANRLHVLLAALDRYAPNPERALALSFRQMDYLGAGLPLIADADTPLGAEIRETAAGWVDEPLEEAIEAALARPRSSEALAARYAPARTEAPLLAWSPERRSRDWSLLRAGARLARADARAAADRAARRAAEAELDRKRAEADALHAQLRALTASVEALSTALQDVAGFRRETVQVLGTRMVTKTDEAEHLRRELEIARVDLEKKTVELESLQQERDRLGRAFALLRRGRG